MLPIALFGLAALMRASAAELALPASVAAPGSSLVLPVSFTSQSSAVAGLQFDLQYDNSALGVSATIGDAARAAGKTLSFHDIAPGQRRFLAWGLNGNPLGDGVAINLFLNLSPNAPAGTYALKIVNAVATDPAGQSFAVNTIDAALIVQGTAGSGPRLDAAGVLNTASLLPGPVAPGELVTLIGRGIGSAAVLFDGATAPLFSVTDTSININTAVPSAIRGKSSVRLQLIEGTETIADLQLAVVDSAPALFTADGSGAGPGAILNQDAAPNTPSTPADKGSIVSLFATGAGQVDPADVSVSIGGRTAPVVYAGSTPGMPAGLLQVNCVVPAEAPSGFAVPVVLSIRNVESPAGVTLSIR